MKLFRFYPGDYVRQYAISENLDDLWLKQDELFYEYIAYNYSYLDYDDLEDSKIITEYRPRFMQGLYKAEAQPLTFIDNHY